MEGVGGGGAPRAFARGIFFLVPVAETGWRFGKFTDGISVHGRGAGGQESKEKSKKNNQKNGNSPIGAAQLEGLLVDQNVRGRQEPNLLGSTDERRMLAKRKKKGRACRGTVTKVLRQTKRKSLPPLFWDYRIKYDIVLVLARPAIPFRSKLPNSACRIRREEIKGDRASSLLVGWIGLGSNRKGGRGGGAFSCRLVLACVP